MKFSASLSSVTKNPEEAIRIIADNLIDGRPKESVVYRPIRKSAVYYDLPGRAGPLEINFKRLYPEAKPGNVVYFSTIFDSSDDSDGYIRFIGEGKIFVDGREIYDSKAVDGNRHSVPYSFKKGANNLVTFMARCTSESSFTMQIMPSVRHYWMWARWYLLNVVAKSPLAEYKGEEGIAISRLYENEEISFDGSYAYPLPPVADSTVDLEKIYPDAKGKIGYALTYATEDTEITLNAKCTAKAFVNGCEVEVGRLILAEGDSLLVKLLREDSWSFSFEGKGLGIPFMESSRPTGDTWLTLADFSSDGKFNSKHGPEYEIQFTKPYRNELGEDSFWKLSNSNDYLRPYLQSRFFGQWFYALMVGTHGLLRASEAVDEPIYKDYFVESTEIMTRYYDYIKYDAKIFAHPSFIEASAYDDDLDSIGSMGRNICELYNIKPSAEAMRVIDALDKSAKTKIPRFEDGTYHRPRDMWSDNTYMSCPFIVRLGKIKKDNSYYEEVVRQLLGFKKRLWMADEKIFSHIFFLDTSKPNNIPWGRGNGWVYVSLTDALINIPDGTPGKDELMKLYLDFTEGIVKCQDYDGLWHQVLNRPDSYQETSCSGMFMLGLSRGINNGWLTRDYIENVKRAYLGLLGKKIADDGNVYDVCMGSSNSKEVEYYMNLGAVDNDDHGTGVILSAISEMIKIKGLNL